MKEYNHQTSQHLSDIEKSMKFEYNITDHDIDRLHKIYEEAKYRFLSVDQFTKILQQDWYHFDNIFEKDFDDNFVHHFKFNVESYIKAWYNEMLKTNPTFIEPNTPATVFYYSDSRAVTITKIEYYKDDRTNEGGIPIPRKVGVVFNDVDCIDYYAGNYDVKPLAADKQRCVEESYTLRKGGRWVREGDSVKDGLRLGIGYHRHFIDPSF